MLEEPIKDNQPSSERKFTVLSLEFRRLDVLDTISLVLYALAIGAYFLLQHTKYRIQGLVGISFAVWYLTTTTAFGLRFRNVYFFIPWLVLSIVFLWAKTSLSYVPLGTFLIYQWIRIFYWNNYHREFIPYEVVRTGYIRFVSKVEGRGGYKEDKSLMRVLFWVGMIFLMCCVYGMVATRI